MTTTYLDFDEAAETFANEILQMDAFDITRFLSDEFAISANYEEDSLWKIDNQLKTSDDIAHLIKMQFLNWESKDAIRLFHEWTDLSIQYYGDSIFVLS